MGGTRRVGRFTDNDDGDGATAWAVFSDVAIALLLVLTLFILAQFLHYERIWIIEEIGKRMVETEERLHAALADDAHLIEITREDDYHQRVKFRAELLFAPCESDVSSRGADLVRLVGSVLGEQGAYFEALQVEGHTDHLPPNPYTCPVEDNWQLSAQRATEVVRILSDPSVFPYPFTLSSVGRGEYHPVLSPEIGSPDDLAENRRIEVVLRSTDRGIIQ